MRDDELTGRIRELLAELARRDTAHLGLDEDLLEALELDSLAALRMLATVERRFDVRFPDDQLSELRTIGRLREAIQMHQPKGTT